MIIGNDNKNKNKKKNNSQRKRRKIKMTFHSDKTTFRALFLFYDYLLIKIMLNHSYNFRRSAYV